jgi:N-acetylglucosaminyldiphosphoundecaprenol N-acetyl-beta-D-mannosaminyltransferase
VTSLLGLDFADLTVAEAAARIADRPGSAPFAYVVTPNADHLVRLSRDPTLHSIYRNAALCLLDSRVVAALSHAMGIAAPAVATGSDLTAALLDRLEPGERITIVGLAPVWLARLVAQYELAPPAHFDPPMGFDRNPPALRAAAAFVRDHPARLVFLAVGSPRQERLAAAIAAMGDAKGTGLCIGASLEFLAGARRRAPRTMQRLGLEWLFRLLADPVRMARRYLIDSPVVIALLWKQRLAIGRSERRLRA